jgi:hypothetical protein
MKAHESAWYCGEQPWESLEAQRKRNMQCCTQIYMPLSARNHAVRSLCTSSSSSFFVVSYLLPRKAYTPQLLQVTS